MDTNKGGSAGSKGGARSATSHVTFQRHKDEIIRLYAVEKMKLADVMEEIKRNHGFEAS